VPDADELKKDDDETVVDPLDFDKQDNQSVTSKAVIFKLRQELEEEKNARLELEKLIEQMKKRETQMYSTIN
jgi:hypothetical protein